MKALKRILEYLRPYWLTVTGAFLSLLLVSSANLLSPLVLGYAIDQGITSGDLGVIGLATGALLLIAVVRGLLSFTQSYWIEKASQHAVYDLRNQLYAHTERLSFSYHDQVQTGQVMTRITNDVDQVRLFMASGFVQILSALLMLLGTATILLMLNWQLALVALTMIPLVGGIFFGFFRSVGPRFREVQQKLGFLNTVLQENLAGVRVVKAFAREQYELERYSRANAELLDENLKVRRAISVSFPSIFFIANLGTLAVIWIGGLQVIGGGLTLGELVAFNTYLVFLIMPVMTIGFSLTAVVQANVSAKRICEVLDTPLEVTDKPDALELPPVRGRVVFTNVSFRYHGSDSPSLIDVSFTVEPGQTVAILGRTGSGKSSIINLIPRFYDVSAGSVTIDGYDVRDVTLTSLRSQIGIVLQDAVLFSGTVRENIAYGRPNASEAEIEAAARAAQAHEFVLELPNGYDTVIGERGVGLSGGQRQRIAIARTLLLDPAVLIFDDSTSAVDAETEYRIQQALIPLLAERTALIIAQRMSTIRNADLILLLDQGRLVNQGRYDYLRENCGTFCELLDAQFGTTEEMAEEILI